MIHPSTLLLGAPLACFHGLHASGKGLPVNILITGSEFNKDDAARCAAWLLGYLRSQAFEDGLTTQQITAATASLVQLRNDLRGDQVPWVMNR
jgi:hypothetical protein